MGRMPRLPIPPPPEDHQFSVSVTSPINTFFLRVFGQNTITMTRQATAEYVLPVPIGSPLNQFGFSPFSGYWASISAPYLERGNGDLYATKCIDSASPSSCNSSNPLYRSDGYWYAIDLPSGSSGLMIDIYDAGFYNRSLTVETGDYDYGSGSTADLRYSFYAPDLTPLIHTDNPPASCSSGWAGSDGIWDVDPEDTSPNTKNQWYSFCDIAATTPGRYILQVETLGTGEAINQYALRAYAMSGADPAVLRHQRHRHLRQHRRRQLHVLSGRDRGNPRWQEPRSGHLRPR